MRALVIVGLALVLFACPGCSAGLDHSKWSQGLADGASVTGAIAAAAAAASAFESQNR